MKKMYLSVYYYSKEKHLKSGFIYILCASSVAFWQMHTLFLNYIVYLK